MQFIIADTLLHAPVTSSSTDNHESCAKTDAVYVNLTIQSIPTIESRLKMEGPPSLEWTV